VALPRGTIVLADREAFGGIGALIAVDPANGRQTTLSKGGMFVDPEGVALAPGNKAFVADQNAFVQGGLFAVDLTTGQQTKIAASTVFRLPTGIFCDPQGQLLVAYANAVMRVDPANGEHHAVAPTVRFDTPTGVTLDDARNVIVTDLDPSGEDSKIHRIAPGGADTILARASPAPGVQYSAVAIEPSGGILVANVSTHGTDSVLRFDPVTGVPTTVSEGHLIVDPLGLALEQSGAIVVVCGGGGVVRVQPATGAQTMVSSGGSLVFPTGVAIAP
jgi:hypothetical protein